jgi:arylsulfatase A-like enzyme
MLGGYYLGTTTPGPLLQSALDYINAQMQRMVNEINNQGLARSTAIILTAKHGQSPQDPTQLLRIDDGAIITAINNAWDQQTGCTSSNCAPLIVAGTDDDVWQSYLSVKTQAAADFFGVPYSDPRHPDVFGIVQVSVVYTTGSKIAEHGGDNPADRDVALLVYAPGTVEHGLDGQYVETTQVAPTILALLGVDPNALQAVQIEHTSLLPEVTATSTIDISTTSGAATPLTGYYTTLSERWHLPPELLLTLLVHRG